MELCLFTVVKRNKDGHHADCCTCNAKKSKKTPSYKKYSNPGGKKWQRMNLNKEVN
jgi:hypothetical protein